MLGVQEPVYLHYLRSSRSSRISQEFKNQFICIISEHSEKYFIENYFNLIILKYQHSASRFAQQQNKEDAYIQNLPNLFDQHQQINKTELNC